MTTTHGLRPVRSLSIAAVAAAALTLSACGSGSDAPAETDGIEQTQSATDDTVPTEESTEGAESSAAATMHRGGSLEDARTAIDTAEAENGGTAHEIDFDDDDHWEIDVIGSDREWEYHVSADGTTIEKTEEDDLDDDDRRELEEAEVSLVEALEIALDHTAGTIDDAELDEDDGVLHWEVEIYVDGSDRTRDLYVDAKSGDVTEDD
ncbi:PepSY domain-containing protein [Brevibacterium yomogidense]|uniref:PepSY domain-containing protein n=1 Tax=Brevibacterium yomogidense TaxID=946573 RepID=UPI0018E04AFD|nr:PepSY domain-containing protein [Brevibacterium yomogidense]